MKISLVHKNIQPIWDKLIHEGYFIAIGDISAIYALSIVLSINITWDLLLVIFLVIFSLLSFNYYKEISQDRVSNPQRALITEKRVRILPYIIIVSVVTAMMLVYYFSSPYTALFVMVLLAGGILYTTSLKAVTRDILGFKSLFVAFFYPLLLILMVMYYHHQFTLAVLLAFLFYFGRIFINTVFCDIRDIEADKKDGLKTIAIVLGKKKSIYVLGWLNVLTVIPIIFGVVAGILPTFSLLILGTVLYTTFTLISYKNSTISYSTLFNVLVEGEFIIWLPLVLIGRLIA